MPSTTEAIDHEFERMYPQHIREGGKELMDLLKVIPEDELAPYLREYKPEKQEG